MFHIFFIFLARLLLLLLFGEGVWEIESKAEKDRLKKKKQTKQNNLRIN